MKDEVEAGKELRLAYWLALAACSICRRENRCPQIVLEGPEYRQVCPVDEKEAGRIEA